MFEAVLVLCFLNTGKLPDCSEMFHDIDGPQITEERCMDNLKKMGDALKHQLDSGELNFGVGDYQIIGDCWKRPGA